METPSTENQILVSFDKSLLQLEKVFSFLKRSHWASNRSEVNIKKSIAGSLCYGAYIDGRQVGFARVVTDYATFAYLCDVFVDEEYRGQGISKLMMEAIMSHPDLQCLRRFLLATKDAHGLYKRYGFSVLSEEETRRYMVILRNDV